MVQDPLLEGWLGHPDECKIQDPLLGGGLGRSSELGGEAKVQDSKTPSWTLQGSEVGK